MPIIKGAPLLASEINAKVATYYPEFAVSLTPLSTGGPLVLNEFFSDQEFSFSIFLAMISPPNMSAPIPVLLNGFVREATVDLVGVGPLLSPGQPVEAPDVFVEFDSGEVTQDGSVFGGSVNVSRQQIDAWKALNPGVRVFGDLQVTYTDGVGPPAGFSETLAWLAGKLPT